MRCKRPGAICPPRCERPRGLCRRRDADRDDARRAVEGVADGLVPERHEGAWSDLQPVRRQPRSGAALLARPSATTASSDASSSVGLGMKTPSPLKKIMTERGGAGPCPDTRRRRPSGSPTTGEVRKAGCRSTLHLTKTITMRVADRARWKSYPVTLAASIRPLSSSVAAIVEDDATIQDERVANDPGAAFPRLVHGASPRWSPPARSRVAVSSIGAARDDAAGSVDITSSRVFGTG